MAIPFQHAPSWPWRFAWWSGAAALFAAATTAVALREALLRIMRAKSAEGIAAIQALDRTVNQRLAERDKRANQQALEEARRATEIVEKQLVAEREAHKATHLEAQKATEIIEKQLAAEREAHEETRAEAQTATEAMKNLSRTVPQLRDDVIKAEGQITLIRELLLRGPRL